MARKGMTVVFQTNVWVNRRQTAGRDMGEEEVFQEARHVA